MDVGLSLSFGLVQQTFSVEGASVWPGSGVDGGMWATSREGTPGKPFKLVCLDHVDFLKASSPIEGDPSWESVI